MEVNASIKLTYRKAIQHEFLRKKHLAHNRTKHTNFNATRMVQPNDTHVQQLTQITNLTRYLNTRSSAEKLSRHCCRKIVSGYLEVHLAVTYHRLAINLIFTDNCHTQASLINLQKKIYKTVNLWKTGQIKSMLKCVLRPRSISLTTSELIR